MQHRAGWQRFRITKEAKQKPRPHVLEDALLLSLAKVRRGSQVPPAPEPNDECRQLRCRPEDEDFGACSCETWASSHVSSAQFEELRSRGEQADASAGRRAGVVDETAVSGGQLMLAPCFLRGNALKEHAFCLCEFRSECDSCQWREPQLGIPYAIHRMRVWPSGTLNPKPLKSMTASMCIEEGSRAKVLGCHARRRSAPGSLPARSISMTAHHLQTCSRL